MPPIDNQYKIRNQEFLQEYAQRPGVKTMFNGVMYRVLNKGNGPKPTPKSYITVYYVGKLIKQCKDKLYKTDEKIKALLEKE